MKKIILLLIVVNIVLLYGCSTQVENEENVQKICTQDWRPVCGVNGETYGNACMAGEIQISYEGECKEAGEIEMWNIESELVDCVGVGPQKCMVVNGNNFYDSVEGFEFEEGFQYSIKIEKNIRENVPADANAYTFKLVELISKTHFCTEEEKQNKMCTREYRPVCGNDGNTYSTGCTGCSEGIESWTEGEC